MFDIWKMDLLSIRRLVGKVNSKSILVHPQENDYLIYQTLIELFTSENNMIGHIYCNVGKLGGVATVMNREFWGIEPNANMVEEGSIAVAEYIYESTQQSDTKVNINFLFLLILY